MEMGLQKESWQKGILNYQTEIASANYPNIRLFTVPKVVADEPKGGLCRFMVAMLSSVHCTIQCNSIFLWTQDS